MAFNDKEKQIIQFGVQSGKSKQEVEEAIKKYRYGSVEPVKPQMTGLQKAKSFATGFGKGAVEGTIETAALLQKGGQAVMAAVDPTRTFKDVQEQTGFPSLKGEQLEGIRQVLKSENSVEKAGKLTELVAELIFPVGKAKEVQTVFSKGGEVVSEGLGKLESSAGGIISKATDVVKKGLKNIFAQPIPEQVKTALSETSGKTFDAYVDIGQKASQSFKNPTPLEFAGRRSEEALDTIQRKLKNIGSTKAQILNQASVGNKPVGSIVVKFRQDLGNALKGKTSIEADTKVYRDVFAEAEKLGSNPSAVQVDKFIDFIQERIYSAKRDLTVPISDNVESTLRSLTGKLNNSLKSQLPDSYSALNKEYSDLVQVRNELNTKLGFEGEKGGALMKRVFSPSDANTKKLFDEVKTITGIDLVDEATVARFIMETLGDARQASLLQELKLPTLSERGMAQLVRDLLAKKFNTTEEILKRARELTTDSQLREAVTSKAK